MERARCQEENHALSDDTIQQTSWIETGLYY